jgi:hypothetical protein
MEEGSLDAAQRNPGKHYVKIPAALSLYFE